VRKSDTVRGLERGLQVLDALQAHPYSSLKDIFDRTAISKPSLLRILCTLERAGFVARRLADGRYRVSGRIARPWTAADQANLVAEAAAPVLEQLCQRVQWPSDLAIPAGDHLESCETSRTQTPIWLFKDRIGHHISWLMSAVGRAYLAYCPSTERDRIVRRLRKSKHSEDRLAQQPARLNAMLREVRMRGYASRGPGFEGGFYGRPPYSDGLSAIAVPILGPKGVHGSINLLWPRQVCDVESFAGTHLSALQQAALEIARRLAR
jgi:IclR family mhp operon transcriptional activator